jgi:hypothetical protein
MKKVLALKNAHLSIFHHGAFNTEKTFMPLVEDFVENLPELVPDVWGITEPYRDPFLVESIREAISSWPGAQWDFDWRRKGKPKAWGGFKKMVWPIKGPRHARQHFYVDLPIELELRLITYLKNTSKKFVADYSVFSWNLESYPTDEALQVWLRTNGDFVGLRSLDMVKHLPAIYWSQVFGPPYVRLFGLDMLLSVPAYKVEQLGPEMVYVQLTESLFDVRDRYEEVDAVRQKVKFHIDDNIIFDPQNQPDHIYRVPDFQFPPKP